MIKEYGPSEMYIDGKYMGTCISSEIDIQVDEVAKKRTEKLLKSINMPKEVTFYGYND